MRHREEIIKELSAITEPGKSTFFQNTMRPTHKLYGKILWDGKELNAKEPIKTLLYGDAGRKLSVICRYIGKKNVYLELSILIWMQQNRQMERLGIMSTVLIIPIHFPGARSSVRPWQSV